MYVRQLYQAMLGKNHTPAMSPDDNRMTSSTPTATFRAATAVAASPSAWDLARSAIERAISTDAKTVLILGFTAPVADPLAWLSHHQGVPSMYWRARDGWEYAGIGATHVIAEQGPEAMRRAADQASLFMRDCVIHESSPQPRRPRFFGGFAFDPQRANGADWHDGGFGDAVLILPEAVYARRDTQAYAFFSFEVTPRTTPDTLVDRLALLNQNYWNGFDAPSAPPPIFGVGVPSNDDDSLSWVAHSAKILQQIKNGALDKVVLARRQSVPLRSEDYTSLNPWPVVASLRDFDPACYQYGFQISDRYAFIGASPERLFRLSGRRLESEAVAGTIARGVDEEEDRLLGERLLASAKDQLEHRYVVEAVQDGLAGLAVDDSNGASSQLDLVRLRTLQHLRSIMSVDLRDDISVGEVLSTLHPTPAVAGVPRDKACEAIRAHETDSRGWYGGPVGWIGADAAEFAVGIRSALLSSDMAWLYAGAGLVSGSVPEDEWREIQDKLQAFRSAVSSPRHTP